MSENQQWLSNETSMKYGSPLTSRNLKTCLSFASIKHQKALYELQTPRHSVTKLNNANGREKTKQNKIILTGHKKKLISKKEQCMGIGSDIGLQQQNSRILMQTLQVQNQSLKQTVQILKQQISALTNSYNALKKQHMNLKHEKQQKLSSALDEVQRYKNKLKQYESIMPKIEELEQLQDNMIEENSKLKDRESILKDLLAQIVIMIGSSSESTALQVKALINNRFNQF